MTLARPLPFGSASDFAFASENMPSRISRIFGFREPSGESGESAERRKSLALDFGLIHERVGPGQNRIEVVTPNVLGSATKWSVVF
jgi:hypothetical protein